MNNYCFGGRLKREFPSQIIVDATEVCNLACIHCPHSEFKKSNHYKGRHLDIDLHRKMVDEVREYGRQHTQYIRYTSNGEPLLHPRIYDMLQYAVLHSGVFVTLTTNGTIMNEKRIERLLSSGLHMVDISIDAFHPETYAKIRRGGKLDKTKANVLKLIGLRDQEDAGTKIVVSYTEQSDNYKETKDFESFWKDQGADMVVIRRLHSAAGGVEQIANDMRKIQETVDRRPCLYPWERILLNPRGELAFCAQDWMHASVMKDYRNSTIQEVWQGEEYRRLREAHLKGCYREFKICGQCPDWAQIQWPGEGNRYADMVETFSEK